MKYLSVKNWGKYQSYKDRKPLWIKLYHKILDKYKDDGTQNVWRALPTEDRLMLVCLWLLAARHDNQIPYDDDWLRAQTGCDPACVTRLLQEGCVFCNDVGAPLVQACNKSVPEPVQECIKSVLSETETETETETEIPPTPRSGVSGGGKKQPKTKPFTTETAQAIQTHWNTVADRVKHSGGAGQHTMRG